MRESDRAVAAEAGGGNLRRMDEEAARSGPAESTVLHRSSFRSRLRCRPRADRGRLCTAPPRGAV